MKRIVTLWLCVLLIVSSVVLVLSQGEDVEAKEVLSDEVVFNISTPFRINSNADFITSPKVTYGDGSIANPWIIENYDINGTGYGYCIYVGNTTDYFIIKDCYLHHASGYGSLYYRPDSGLVFYNVQNGILLNNSAFSNDWGGIRLSLSENNSISNNTVTDNPGGIILYYSDNNTIINNTAYNTNKGIDLWIDCHDNQIINNNASNNEMGIVVWIGNNNQVIGNIANENEEEGIYLYEAHNGIVENNTAISNNWSGVRIIQSSNNTVKNNTALNNTLYGISLNEANYNRISENNASSNMLGGIRLDGESNIIENNDVFYNINGILLLEGMSNPTINNVIANNTVSLNNNQGISLDNSDFNSVISNTVTNNQHGIYLDRASGNSIEDNHIFSNAETGIYVFWFSESNIINNNNVETNKCGILLNYSVSNCLTNNTMIEDGLFIDGDSLEYWNSHTIDASNSLNGNPIYYWKNQTNGTVLHGAQVILANCSNIVVENQSSGDGFAALVLGFSSNNILINNSYTNFEQGIHLYESNENELKNNTISNGIAGMRLESSNSNEIYHNNFIDNINQASDDDVNSWDNDYPSGGNYWSDYIGNDSFGGFNQEANGSDGIGDTNYSEISNGLNVDRYPLMTKYSGYGLGAIDSAPPMSYLMGDISPYWRNYAHLNLNVNATDAISDVSNVSLWYRFSLDNTTWGNWTSFATINATLWGWSFDFPDGEGYYEFYSIAIDNVGLIEAVPAAPDALCAYDSTNPITDAGPNQEVNASTLVMFDGLGSFDSQGIDNYTWSFIYNGTLITLYGPSSQFKFWTPGVYTVTLETFDVAGNSNSCALIITVKDFPSGPLGDYWWAILIATVIIIVLVLIAFNIIRKDPIPPPGYVQKEEMVPDTQIEMEAEKPSS